MTLHTVQQPQPQHPTWRKDGNPTPHTAQWPQHNTAYSTKTVIVMPHMVQQLQSWHPMQRNNHNSNTLCGAITATIKPHTEQWPHVTILPPFFTFPTHVTSCALSVPCHLPTCTQHVPPNHGTYSHLHRTYVHHPICPCPYLVPHGYAMASYHIPLTRSSSTPLPPLVLYTFPIWYASWSLSTSQIYHVSPLSEALCFFPWFSTTLSFVYCFRLRTVLRSRLRPSPVYKPLSRHLCLSSLTWSLILSLVQCSTIPLCVPLCKNPLKPSAA
jgi:hypothetical protein